MTTPRFYRTTLVKGGPAVPVKVWYGPPHDPVTREPLDRSHRWQAERNGRPVDIEWVMLEWDHATGAPIINADEIDEVEYRLILETNRWAERHDPSAPEAALRTPINFNTMKPLF